VVAAAAAAVVVVVVVVVVVIIIIIRTVIAQSALRWATGWTIPVLGFDSRRGLGIFLSPPCPERLWGSPSLLYNGYQGPFP
jgi:hypothetical protein